jgi:hypothetical protein
VICDQLNLGGSVGAPGGKQSPSTLACVLKNENYVGSCIFGPTVSEILALCRDDANLAIGHFATETLDS